MTYNVFGGTLNLAQSVSLMSMLPVHVNEPVQSEIQVCVCVSVCVCLCVWSVGDSIGDGV